MLNDKNVKAVEVYKIINNIREDIQQRYEDELLHEEDVDRINGILDDIFDAVSNLNNAEGVK